MEIPLYFESQLNAFGCNSVKIWAAPCPETKSLNALLETIDSYPTTGRSTAISSLIPTMTAKVLADIVSSVSTSVVGVLLFVLFSHLMQYI